MYRLPRAAPAIAMAVIASFGGATAAQAALSPAATVTGSGLDVERFATAMNPSGERSALVFAGRARGTGVDRRLLFARLGHGHRFERSQRLEDLRRGSGVRVHVSISGVKVAVSPDGDAVAAWIVTTATRDYGRSLYALRVATAPAGERFGRPQTPLRTTRSLELDGLVAGRGGLAVLALRRDERVEVAVRRAGGRFGARQRIGASSSYRAPPTLVLAQGGTVVAGWSPRLGSAALAAVLPARARRFRAARSVSAAGEPTRFARAVAGPGGAGIAWVTQPQGNNPELPGPVRFARLRAGAGGFAAPVTIAGDGANGAPAVAIPRLGIATAWRRYDVRTEPGDSDFFVNSRLAATASWIAEPGPRALSQLPALAFRPVLAALADRALVAWREAPAYEPGTRMRLAVAGPRGWLPTVTLPPDGSQPQFQTRPSTGIVDDEYADESALSLAAGGRSALLAWTSYIAQEDGDALGRVRVASYRP